MFLLLLQSPAFLTAYIRCTWRGNVRADTGAPLN